MPGRTISMSNGLVQNVNQFSGDLAGNFGTIHIASTLNDVGTHAAGTYTVTPPQSGNCLGVSLTGTFTGDEVPSMSGNWTGTATCVLNCPIGPTSGNVSMSLTQNDATGAITGSYTITGGWLHSARETSCPILTTCSAALAFSKNSWTTTGALILSWADLSTLSARRESGFTFVHRMCTKIFASVDKMLKTNIGPVAQMDRATVS